jgi:hypothetical protein
MTIHDLISYADAASNEMDIGVVVRHIYTGEEIAASFDVVAGISEYGELMICIAIEP